MVRKLVRILILNNVTLSIASKNESEIPKKMPDNSKKNFHEYKRNIATSKNAASTIYHRLSRCQLVLDKKIVVRNRHFIRILVFRWSQFEIVSFITIRIIEFGHNLSNIMSH